MCKRRKSRVCDSCVRGENVLLYLIHKVWGFWVWQKVLWLPALVDRLQQGQDLVFRKLSHAVDELEALGEEGVAGASDLDHHGGGLGG